MVLELLCVPRWWRRRWLRGLLIALRRLPGVGGLLLTVAVRRAVGVAVRRAVGVAAVHCYDGVINRYARASRRCALRRGLVMHTALSRNSRTGREVERVAADLAGMALSSSNAACMRGRADSSTIDPQPASVVDTLDPNIEGAVEGRQSSYRDQSESSSPAFNLWFDGRLTQVQIARLDLHRL